MAVGRPPVYQIWYKERKLTQCYSFLLPFPLRLSASCSLFLSLPPAAVVCSQHVANRVNDVDACRKSHSGSVGIASGRRVSRTMTDFFLVSRPESVASPFLPKHHEGYRVSTLVAIPGAGAPSLFIRVFVLPHELSCVFDSACTLSSVDAMKFCKLFSYLLRGKNRVRSLRAMSAGTHLSTCPLSLYLSPPPPSSLLRCNGIRPIPLQTLR